MGKSCGFQKNVREAHKYDYNIVIWAFCEKSNEKQEKMMKSNKSRKKPVEYGHSAQNVKMLYS
jgi:hypothetical protein